MRRPSCIGATVAARTVPLDLLPSALVPAYRDCRVHVEVRSSSVLLSRLGISVSLKPALRSHRDWIVGHWFLLLPHLGSD